MKLVRKLKRNKEKAKLEEIRNTYGKKPKDKCPKCKKATLFMKTNNGEIYCIRCDERVK